MVWCGADDRTREDLRAHSSTSSKSREGFGDDSDAERGRERDEKGIVWEISVRGSEREVMV